MTETYNTTAVIRLTNLNVSNLSNPDTSQKIIQSRAYINTINNDYKMNLKDEYINKLISPDNNILSINSNNGQFININISGEDPEKITSIACSKLFAIFFLFFFLIFNFLIFLFF
jgi:ABC-type Na+ efflux pump permease subunit